MSGLALEAPGIPRFVLVSYHEGMIDETAIRSRFEAMRARLDEQERRLFAAAEARSAGYGGVSAAARATGIARSTIDRRLKDLRALDPARPRVRRPGGGRRALTRTDPTLLEDLRGLLEKTFGVCSNRRRWAIRCERSCGCPRAMPNSRWRCAI